MTVGGCLDLDPARCPYAVKVRFTGLDQMYAEPRTGGRSAHVGLFDVFSGL